MPALSIKNEEAYRLVRELAALRGESMTQAAIEIAREAIERDKPAGVEEQRVERWLEIDREIRARASEDWLNTDHGEYLYDEHGLPK